MTDPMDRGARPAARRPHHGEHEPGPGTVPAAELLAGFGGVGDRGAGQAPGADDRPSADGDRIADEGNEAEGGDVRGEGSAGGDGSTEGDGAPHTEQPAPMLVASGLGLHTGRGWVFRDVDITARPGTVTALVGPAGSGRSGLLLALAGRMSVTDGTLTIAGRSAIADPRAARARTAIARVADLIVPEERLTVAESVTERCLIDAVRPARGRDAFRRACETMAVTLDGAVLVEDLAPHEQTILALALATIRPADVIVLDDTDRGVTADGEREIYRAALALAESGPAVVTTTTRTEAIPVSVAAVALPTEISVTATSEDER